MGFALPPTPLEEKLWGGVVIISFLVFLVLLDSFLGVLVFLALSYKGRDLVEGSWKVLLQSFSQNTVQIPKGFLQIPIGIPKRFPRHSGS